jgi:hypothetical protein
MRAAGFVIFTVGVYTPQNKGSALWYPAAESVGPVVILIVANLFLVAHIFVLNDWSNVSTATVPRYYWSQDVGYALWLRLAHDAGPIARSN